MGKLEENDPISVDVAPHDLLCVLEALRFYGKYATTHHDCTPVSYKANGALLRLRNDIIQKHPDLFKAIMENECISFYFNPVEQSPKTKQPSKDWHAIRHFHLRSRNIPFPENNC